MSGTLSLAAAIAAMDREALGSLASSRRVSSPAQVHDALSFAIELMRPDSITRALQGQPREALVALLQLSQTGAAAHGFPTAGSLPSGSADDLTTGTSADAPSDELIAQLTRAGLVGRDVATGRSVALPELGEQLSRISLHADAEAPLSSTEVGSDENAPVDTSSWYGSALTSVRRTAKLLFAAGRHPIKLGRKGSPAVASLKALAVAAHCEPDEVSRLVEVMRAADLLTSTADRSGALQLITTVTAMDSWLTLDYPRRWLALASETIGAFDEKLRCLIERSGPDFRDISRRLAYEYPLLPQADREHLLRSVDTCEDLGLTVGRHLTPAALALLADEAGAALAIAEADIPKPATGIYLQPDLSIVVPGPLPFEDEVFLHTVAETEQLGAAASMRMDTRRLGRVVQRGVYSTREIRDTLQRLSLTGVPQPLEYTLRELAERFVDEDHMGEDHIDPPGAPAVLGEAAPGPGEGADPIAEMVDRVYSSAHDSDEQGDLTRRLKLAIRDRVSVQVTAVAGANQHVFTLLPVSLQGGRLRATDQQAGVERTLPISAITSVVAA